MNEIATNHNRNDAMYSTWNALLYELNLNLGYFQGAAEILFQDWMSKLIGRICQSNYQWIWISNLIPINFCGLNPYMKSLNIIQELERTTHSGFNSIQGADISKAFMKTWTVNTLFYDLHFYRIYVTYTKHYFVRSLLKSQSFFANSLSSPWGLGLERLLSEKYSPLTPLAWGCNAT